MRTANRKNKTTTPIPASVKLKSYNDKEPKKKGKKAEYSIGQSLGESKIPLSKKNGKEKNQKKAASQNKSIAGGSHIKEHKEILVNYTPTGKTKIQETTRYSLADMPRVDSYEEAETVFKEWLKVNYPKVTFKDGLLWGNKLTSGTSDISGTADLKNLKSNKTQGLRNLGLVIGKTKTDAKQEIVIKMRLDWEPKKEKEIAGKFLHLNFEVIDKSKSSGVAKSYILPIAQQTDDDDLFKNMHFLDMTADHADQMPEPIASKFLEVYLTERTELSKKYITLLNQKDGLEDTLYQAALAVTTSSLRTGTRTSTSPCTMMAEDQKRRMQGSSSSLSSSSSPSLTSTSSS